MIDEMHVDVFGVLFLCAVAKIDYGEKTGT